MANYMMDVEKQLDRQFSIAIKGYTFKFDTNLKGYQTWAERTKRRIRRKAIELCHEWGNFIASEAKKRCPHYSGGLEQAIKVSGARGIYDKDWYGNSVMSISVGVDGMAWQSSYDDVAIRLAANGKISELTLASPQLAVFLHENWDNVAGDEARKRALRKERAIGEGKTVGSHFLLRAYTENEAELKGMATKMYINPLSEHQSSRVYDEAYDRLLDEFMGG